jgi:hypothetical protein
MSETGGARRGAGLGDYALSLCLLAFVWSAIFYVLKGPWGNVVWLSAAILVVRYGLLGLAALFVRPWPFKLVLAGSVLTWGVVDLLAVTGIFDVYGLLMPVEDFIYFQF